MVQINFAEAALNNFFQITGTKWQTDRDTWTMPSNRIKPGRMVSLHICHRVSQEKLRPVMAISVMYNLIKRELFNSLKYILTLTTTRFEHWYDNYDNLLRTISCKASCNNFQGLCFWLLKFWSLTKYFLWILFREAGVGLRWNVFFFFL